MPLNEAIPGDTTAYRCKSASIGSRRSPAMALSRNRPEGQYSSESSDSWAWCAASAVPLAD